MKDLSLTQEYFICAVNDKGKLSGFNVERLVCLLASGMLELQLSGCIRIDDGKKHLLTGSGKSVSVAGPLPDEKAFLRPLYDYLNQGKPMKMEKILEDYHYSFSGKRLNALIGSIGESLARKGWHRLRTQGCSRASDAFFHPETPFTGWSIWSAPRFWRKGRSRRISPLL